MPEEDSRFIIWRDQEEDDPFYMSIQIDKHPAPNEGILIVECYGWISLPRARQLRDWLNAAIERAREVAG